MASRFLKKIAKTAFTASLGAAVVSSPYTVISGKKAVLFDRFRGVLPETVGEGTHFLIPWVQRAFMFDIRPRKLQFSSISRTKDRKKVNLTLLVSSRPDEEGLAFVFEYFGPDYDQKVFPSIGDEVVRSVVAQFNADELRTERPRVTALVRDGLIKSARDFHILLDDVVITHLCWGNEFSNAVERKQVAQHEPEIWL